MGARGVVQAVDEALAAIRADGPGNLAERIEAAERALDAAVRQPLRTAPDAAMACVQAAREHLLYGELPEARLLLTEAARLLPVVPVQARERTSRAGGGAVTRA